MSFTLSPVFTFFGSALYQATWQCSRLEFYLALLFKDLLEAYSPGTLVAYPQPFDRGYEPTAGAPAAQPAAAAQGNQEGIYQGARDPPPLDPAMRFVHERVDFIQGEEEFWAERILVEEQNNLEHAEHVNAMRARLAEEQFFYHLSQETRQQAYQWEASERTAYDAHFRSAAHRLFQNVAQERLNMEATVGQQCLALHQELQEAEQDCTQNIRHEARRFADETPAKFTKELQYHQTAQTQAQLS